MANLKISEMLTTLEVTGDELIPVVSNGVNKKITLNQTLIATDPEELEVVPESPYATKADVELVRLTAGDNIEITNKLINALGYVYDPNYESFSEGYTNEASGSNSHAEGYKTKTLSDSTHAEGENTIAYGYASHAEGLADVNSEELDIDLNNPLEVLDRFDLNYYSNLPHIAYGENSHVEGYDNLAFEYCSHAEGYQTKACGRNSHVEGNLSIAEGDSAHAEGNLSIAKGDYSHAEGFNVNSLGDGSHAEGINSTAYGEGSHAEGTSNFSLDDAYIDLSDPDSVIQDFKNFSSTTPSLAYGDSSHAEGHGTLAFGYFSHAEGEGSLAEGDNSHAEGHGVEASGFSSHAEGYVSKALTWASHAEGEKAIAYHYGQHALGCYNILGSISDNFNINSDAFVIGNGKNDYYRSNALKVSFNGTIYSDNTTIQPGADYAEMFEWKDSNPDKEDRVGYFVTLNEDKIEKAKSNSYVLGVISSRPTVLGDAPMRWNNKYLTDEWGRIIDEDIEVERVYKEFLTDEEIQDFITKFKEKNPENKKSDEDIKKLCPKLKEVKKLETIHVHKLNPEYDPEKQYIPREERKEWSAVGLLGKLLVRQDGSLKVGDYCTSNDDGIATKSDKGYYVLNVISKDQVKILLK